MNSHIITLYSSKGGVGKSFITANLAADIQLETKQKILLIDFGRPFSNDISYFLNLTRVKRLDSLFRMAETLYVPLLKGYATVHASGVNVLTLSEGLNNVNETHLNPDNIEKVFSGLATLYDYIIIDAGTTFDQAAEKLFDLSSIILIPTTPDYLSLMQTKSDLKLFQGLGFPKERIKVVVNMVDRPGAANVALISRELNNKDVTGIPFDGTVMSKMKQGTFPETFPRHPVTQALDQLVYELLQALQNQAGRPGDNYLTDPSQKPDIDSLKRRIHEKLLETIDFKKLDTGVEHDSEKMAELRAKVSSKISQILDEENLVQERSLREHIIKAVLQESLGLGPLEDILAQPEVSEIMVNRWDDIYIEKQGRLEHINQKFFSEQHLFNIINRITAPLGRKIDISTPMVDARLKDGSRVNAIIPPLAIKGACLTIRKFPEEQIGIDSLVALGSLNKQMVEFLKAAVISKLNILISGGTGSGKTTLLNILSSFIPEGERIITIEDSAELQLRQPHVVTLESRPENIEGKGEISIRDLVRNSLRMRPDRIIVGECRGAEALDMLQAMNTGHDGSLTTIHSNSCREALSRLETLVMYAGFELPSKAIKEQIVGAVDIILQISRLKDGSRKLIQVAEIDGMQGDTISMGDIFVFHAQGESGGRVSGNFKSTGYVPRCVERFAERGMTIPREVFWTSD
jgi:pilus assembly protein CpaF